METLPQKEYLPNVLTLETPTVCTEEEILSSLRSFFEVTGYSFGKKDYVFNYATDVENKYKGFSFLWLRSKEAFNLLLGKNADGSVRMEKTKSDRYEQIQELDNFILEVVEMNGGLSPRGSVDWCVVLDLEEMVSKECGPEYILKETPLFPLPVVKDADGKAVPIKISAATKVRPRPDRARNILFAQRVCDTVNVEKLRVLFSMVLSCKEDRKPFKIEEYRHPYTGRCIKVIFDEENDDALLIWSVFRKRLVKTKKGTLSPIIFGYYFRGVQRDEIPVNSRGRTGPPARGRGRGRGRPDFKRSNRR